MKKRVISVLLAAGMIAGALAGCGGASGGAAAESGAAEDLPYSGVTPMIGTFGDTWTSQVLFLGDNYNVISENPTFAEDFTAGTAIQEQSLKSEVFLLPPGSYQIVPESARACAGGYLQSGGEHERHFGRCDQYLSG